MLWSRRSFGDFQNQPGRFAKPFWPVSSAWERLSLRELVWPVSATGLTDFGFWQCFVLVFDTCFQRLLVGLLLGPVALLWLCGFGKRSKQRSLSDFGFIGRILEYDFYQLPLTPPLWFAVPVLHIANLAWSGPKHFKSKSSTIRWYKSSLYKINLSAYHQTFLSLTPLGSCKYLIRGVLQSSTSSSIVLEETVPKVGLPPEGHLTGLRGHSDRGTRSDR
jgi:hypothetical protein